MKFASLIHATALRPSACVHMRVPCAFSRVHRATMYPLAPPSPEPNPKNVEHLDLATATMDPGGGDVGK